jgi:hypothetical protein
MEFDPELVIDAEKGWRGRDLAPGWGVVGQKPSTMAATAQSSLHAEARYHIP